jgi:hypothetical protein
MHIAKGNGTIADACARIGTLNGDFIDTPGGGLNIIVIFLEMNLFFC